MDPADTRAASMARVLALVESPLRSVELPL